MAQERVQLNISLDKTTPLVCDSCGGNVFQEGTVLRKASKFLTGTTQDGIIPIPTFYCVKCGHVNEEFIPAELRTPKAEA
jgi:uncharacterized Zn finger protein